MLQQSLDASSTQLHPPAGAAIGVTTLRRTRGPRMALSGAAPGVARPTRILVVEDSMDLAVVLERVIRSVAGDCNLDWETRASNGARRLRTSRYDVVIADYFLDGPRSGLSLYDDCARYQDDARFAMMSSLALGSFRAITGGRVIPYLPKPFTVGEFRGFLHSVFDRTPKGAGRDW